MSSKIIDEANRIMTICNACRYCEGFCAVFPAMELRRIFTESDLKYMANLCHNCRGCYYACQYAPPHEFDLNVPRTLAELRLQTYQEFAWPASFKGLFNKNGKFVTTITALCVLLFTLVSLITHGPSAFFASHTGPGSFYAIIPYPMLLVLFSAAGIFACVSLWKGMKNLWRVTEGKADMFRSRAYNLRAVWDVLRLRYLEGGGDGCNYPDDKFSMQRRTMHHFTFYGFLLCFASTVVALTYDHVLGIPAPYAFSSLPVLLGTFGGLSLAIGSIGLYRLKKLMDKEPAYAEAFPMDISFILLLCFVTVSGLLLMLFRSTGIMGFLLCIHLGLVMGLFITMPYSKFVHGIYRYAALVRHAGEQMQASPAGKKP
jgi:citrate/tricarballylate utilization protein